MRVTPARISLTENQSRSVLEDAAIATGKTRQEVAALLADASRRVRKLQRLTNEPILIDGDHVVVEEVAGLIRVDVGLELEVAPKFLGHGTAGWREDFFRVASLARGGRILPIEDISAGHGASNDLASLVGLMMVRMFKHERRRPIRLYRWRSWADFDIDGDLDEESVFLPAEAGFQQEKIALERSNRFNAVIAEAARLLVLEVENQDIRRQLQRMYAELSPQDSPLAVASAPRYVQSRHRRWQPLYELSRRIVEGFGAHFEKEEAPAPGFVIRTWPAWEDLLFLALRAGLAEGLVEEKRGYELGERYGRRLTVTPDGTVGSSMGDFLWDAKYKANVERGQFKIASTDVYEGLAFLDAARLERIALLYPRLATSQRERCGAVEVFDRIEVDTRTVMGMFVEVRGISARGGFDTFARNLAAGVTVMGQEFASEVA